MGEDISWRAVSLQHPVARAHKPQAMRIATIDSAMRQLHLTARRDKSSWRWANPSPCSSIRLEDIKPARHRLAAMRADAQRALEVHVFPKACAAPARHRPFDLEPQSTMTTARSCVTGSVVHLTVTYKGARRPSSCRRTRHCDICRLDRAAVPGACHRVGPGRPTQSDGDADRRRKDGLVPPM